MTERMAQWCHGEKTCQREWHIGVMERKCYSNNDMVTSLKKIMLKVNKSKKCRSTSF